MDSTLATPTALAVLLGALLLGGLTFVTEGGADSHPVEVGPVEWGRDFDRALTDSRQSGKPVFAFFQEVPGCAGCRKFGSEVMSHPAVVQAVRDEFVPVLVYNNRGGKDAALLERYQEPAWNYQVIRFLDGAGVDLIPRKDRVWTLSALSARMIAALKIAGRPVPRYLDAAAVESDTAHHARAAFSQHCFWTGEVELGRIPGVVTTEAGFIRGAEVTLLTYHTGLVSLEALVDQATGTDSALKVFLPTESERQRVRKSSRLSVGTLDDGAYRRAPSSDQKRQIRASPLFRLGLSPMQLTKVNAFAPADLQEALAWLTPDQRTRYRR